MKLKDALLFSDNEDKKIKKALKKSIGGKTEKVIKDNSLPSNYHTGYDSRIDNVQDTQRGFTL